MEVDLLRGGRPGCRWKMHPVAITASSSAASRNGPKTVIWPLGLRDPLPKVPIPLQAPQPHVWLDLQALLHRIYDEAGYADYLYQEPPEPPLAVPRTTPGYSNSCQVVTLTAFRKETFPGPMLAAETAWSSSGAEQTLLFPASAAIFL